MPDAAGEFEPQSAAERIGHKRRRSQLHALEIVDLLQYRRLTLVLDGFPGRVAADTGLELGDRSPVPAPLLIQESKRKRGVAQVIPHLHGRTQPPFSEHVAE